MRLVGVGVTFVFSSLLISHSFATEIHLNFKNSGGEKQKVDIVDEICNKPRFSDHWAANDAHIIEHFCVRDAAQLKSDFQVSIDGQPAFEGRDVVEDSVIDIDTGQISQP